MPKTPENFKLNVFGWYLERHDSSLINIDAFILILVVAAAIFCAFDAEQIVSANDRVTCKSFLSRAEAQNAFDQDPKKYRALDRDHDGKVCESYP